MRTLHLAVALLTWTLIAFAQAPSGLQQVKDLQLRSSTNGIIEGQVIDVINGDTITVKSEQESPYSVKLQAIDAPDVGQPYFENSRNSLSKLINKKQVRVEVYTMYGDHSCIGTVYLNGHDVALSLLETGMAWHFKRYAYQQSAESRKSYSEAQSYALEAGLGLWADDRPTPPWVFRGDPLGAGKIGSDPSPAPTSGRKYNLGPRGGCYYVSDSGNKVYVKDKSLCNPAKRVGEP
jgi:endonuclease YncB( thermonuclease family)